MPTMFFSPDGRDANLRATRVSWRQSAAVSPIRWLAFTLLIAGLDATLIGADDAAASPHAEILREHAIEPDAPGLAKYLREMHPDEQLRREMLQLVEQLGSERFADRESATRRLMSLPMPPTRALRIAARSGDPEVRYRASRILAVDESKRLTLRYAVLKVIEQEKTPGLAAALLRIVPICQQRHMQLALQAAVRATATPGDLPLLRRATNDENKEVVIAAVGGLGAASEDGDRDVLRRLLDHKTEEIRLAAARALADRGDRTSLPRIVKLLDAASTEVRLGAAQTLRQVSKTQQSYSVNDDPSARKEAIARWAAWVGGAGRTAKLHFPLASARKQLGRTLITIASQNKVIELDAQGNQIWEMAGLANPWGCTGLANGHRQVSSRDGRFVAQYDADGKEVWRLDGLAEGPINLRRLANGNTLIAFFVAQKVMEIRPDGSTAWEMTTNGGPVDVQRLDNGRTLVTLHQPEGRLLEVDREGKAAWELNGLSMPMTAQRLENGNTLVAEYGNGRVAEWDRHGAIVWQPMGLSNPYSAERLFSGNTLIAHRTDVREIDRRGKIVWQKQITEARHATRY